MLIHARPMSRYLIHMTPDRRHGGVELVCHGFIRRLSRCAAASGYCFLASSRTISARNRSISSAASRIVGQGLRLTVTPLDSLRSSATRSFSFSTIVRLAPVRLVRTSYRERSAVADTAVEKVAYYHRHYRRSYRRGYYGHGYGYCYQRPILRLWLPTALLWL